MGLEAAVEHFRERASFATKGEVEVESPADAPRAAEAGADIVLDDGAWDSRFRRVLENPDGAFVPVRIDPETAVVRDQSYAV